MLVRSLLCAAFVAASPLAAQGFTMSGAGGAALPLPDGRLAVLQPVDGVLTVKTLVDGQGPGAAVDIAVGDRLVRIQDRDQPTAEQLTALLEAIPAGGEVLLRLVRGAAAPREVRFPKPAAGGGRAMVVTGGGGAGAGAWVTGGGDAPESLAIAGAEIRENGEGMPEVMSRRSDPAAVAVPLRVGDVIVAVNGRSIAALLGLTKFYGDAAAGSRIELTVVRGGRKMPIAFVKPGA
ncbi:MAG: PDZ domain-containing protein [Gemmatimonadales bacterium]